MPVNSSSESALKMIYLDNAATTFIHPDVIQVIQDSLGATKGNPSSVHELGFKATREWNATKDAIADIFEVSKKNLIFNSSGTEANNIVIQGRYFKHPHTQMITTATEHSSVLNTFKALEDRGANVTYLDVNDEGFIALKELEASLKKAPTSLVSILHTNNETGAIQDVHAIRDLAHRYGALVHFDMVQVPMHAKANLKDLGCDFATFSAHKFFGPKGIGLTYIKDLDSLKPHTVGGSQEHRLRAGTQNLSFARGFLKALEITEANRTEWHAKIDHLAHTLIEKLDASSLNYKINGPALDGSRILGTLNLAFPGLDAIDLRFALNSEDIYVSLGSACDADSMHASHVLRAMFPDDEARVNGSLRISFSPDLTDADMATLVHTIEEYAKSA